MFEKSVERGLIIRSPHIERILSGKKNWEIRGSNTNIRETIALIRSQSGLIIGTADLVDSKGPFILNDLNQNRRKACIDHQSTLPYPRTYAWVLENATALEEPITYKHPSGAVIWVRLDPDVREKIRKIIDTNS